jgi:hypothetical protein
MRFLQSIAVRSAVIVTLLAGPVTILARADYTADDHSAHVLTRPTEDILSLDFAVHNIGRIVLTITNYGQFGTDDMNFICNGEPCPSCEYPANSDIRYLYTGALWIGAVVGQDTLVSVGADGWTRNVNELLPDAGPRGKIIRRSSLRSKPDYDPEAVSEQDFICTFTDTNTNPVFTGGDGTNIHTPLNISVSQRSYAWSYEYADDFIILDYRITNIGRYPIREMYIGLYIDADVYHESREQKGHTDDICGFRRTVAMPDGFGFDLDTVNIAWIADNDGDPAGNHWDFASPVAVTGTRVLRSPNEDLQYSFNWWISNGEPSLDFGPRLAGTTDDPFRSFGSQLGTPTGDENKYYIMRHKEFDYDQLFTAVSHTDQGFLPPPPPSWADSFATGFDTRYLLSFGPFDINPGDSLPITIAYVAGDNFHPPDGASDFRLYFDLFQPDVYYNKLDFSNLGANARWASWVYDNPGYDTDHDENNDSGRYYWACPDADSTLYLPETEMPPAEMVKDCRKVYYKGDGVPDLRAASPPPPPVVKVIPEFGRATIRWNGQLSENAIDIFSGEKDFEGYRVYYSLGPRQSDFVMLISFDLDDYKVYTFNAEERVWKQASAPMTRDRLQTLYGYNFDPNEYYDPYHSFTDQTSGRIMYFVPQDWNRSDLTDPLAIHRVYPDASKDDLTDTTADGWQRYYEYEYVLDNIQPSTPYYFAVTTFDYGSLKVDLGSLETSPLVNAVEAFALPASERVEEEPMRVIVYPNPYRIDGGYARAGYENRDRTRSAERARAIHFANLPHQCIIRIYTLSGDLVKQIDHSYALGDPKGQHEEWDVVSRNTQSVVSGIYLWHVQSAMGEQLGKLVIIK